MAYSSPTKIPFVCGEEFARLRDKFRLVAYSAVDESNPRIRLKQDVTELGVTVMRKIGGLNGENKFLRKELATVKKTNERLNAELAELRALKEFWGNDLAEVPDIAGEDPSGSDTVTD